MCNGNPRASFWRCEIPELSLRLNCVNGANEHSNNGKSSPVRAWFHAFSAKTSALVGTPWAFILAAAVIVAWAATGPVFHYSDTWQLVINTGTTIVTFLMVFLIQNTQNRDARALHLKLDELIRAKKGARNRLVDLENCTDEELEDLEKEFHELRDKRQERPPVPHEPHDPQPAKRGA